MENKKKTLLLSSAGLKNIITDVNNEGNEFCFIFGGHEVRMSKIFADFISPLISQIHQSDPTMKKYKYPSDDCMKTIFSESNLEHFKNICNGNEVKINEKEGRNLQDLSILLWNEELFKTIDAIFEFDKKEMKIDEIFSYQFSSR